MKVKNKIICTYKKDAKWGFGDFLRGSLATKKFCSENDFDFDLDFSKHEIGKFISSGYCGDEYDEKCICDHVDWKKYRETQYDDTYLCCNQMYGKDWHKKSMVKILDEFAKSISKSDLKFFEERIVFSDSVSNELDSRLERQNIKSYKVVHVRFGDLSFSQDSAKIKNAPKLNQRRWKYSMDQYFNFMIKLIEYYSKEENYIFISDNFKLKNLVSEHISKNSIKNWFVLTGEPSHTSRNMLKTVYEKPIISDLFETAIDLLLLRKSQENFTFSSYCFSSNFVHWISLIFGVKYNVLNIEGRDLYLYEQGWRTTGSSM